MRRTAVIDFNSFFASVEQSQNARYQGKPLAVIPVAETPATCCIAASIEAKQFGIKTGTPVWEAKLKCPGIVFVHGEHSKYVRVHERAVQIIDHHLPIHAVMSIDEVSCVLSGTRARRDRITHRVSQLRRALRLELGPCMSVSVGVAPNTLLAKLASDMMKPNGFVWLDADDIPGKFLHLPIGAICGIGPRMQKRLERDGIRTMAALYAAPRETLAHAWGSVMGEVMHDRLHGLEPRLHAHQTSSLSHSHVLPPAMRNPTDALAVLDRLTQKIAMRLRKQGHYATAMSVFALAGRPLRYGEPVQPGHRCVGANARFGETQDTALLLRWMHVLWQRGPINVATPKHVGVVLHGLVDAAHHTPELFTASPSGAIATAHRQSLCAALDTLNRRHHKNLVYFGGAQQALEHAPMRIAFNRIPDLETER